MMRVLLQRVKHASVLIENETVGEIQTGFCLLVGICPTDNEEIVRKVANKIIDLRIFEDDDGKMNLDIYQASGNILSISQFTLYADYKKGRRPSFTKAAPPEQAKPLWEYFNQCLQERNIVVSTGVFGADMQVILCNDGPVTICIDSDELM